MKCRNCANFKPEIKMEAGEEFFPDLRPVRGKCNIGYRSSNEISQWGCEKFVLK
ncbi:MAG: hypothetical protein N2645_08715 [Clostridia bacterium]|nr:hypothetical protein [Clostridia bacterium]